MPSFKDLDQIKDHAKYKAELKTALRTAAGKKFLYYKKHKLTPGRNYLLVIDCDIGISKMLGPPTAEGKCALNEAKQLVMNTTKGTWKVRPVKKYVEAFYTEREIWVAADEVDEVEESDTKAIAAGSQPGTAATVQSTGRAEPAKKFPSTPPPPLPASDTKPAVATAANPPLPKTLPTRPAPPSVKPLQPDAMLNTLAVPAQPGTKGPTTQPTVKPTGQTPPQTTMAAKPAPTLATRPPPPSNTDQVRKERRLSTYMTGKRTWREAKIGAEAELQRLEKVIVDSCNGEPFAAEVAAKTKQLFGLIAQMDDSIGERLDQASTMEDAERQAHLLKQVLQTVQKNRSALKGNALAGVVDDNPFGKFHVRAQLDSVLAKLETDFA